MDLEFTPEEHRRKEEQNLLWTYQELNLKFKQIYMKIMSISIAIDWVKNWAHNKK